MAWTRSQPRDENDVTSSGPPPVPAATRERKTIKIEPTPRSPSGSQNPTSSGPLPFFGPGPSNAPAPRGRPPKRKPIKKPTKRRSSDSPAPAPRGRPPKPKLIKKEPTPRRPSISPNPTSSDPVAFPTREKTPDKGRPKPKQIKIEPPRRDQSASSARKCRCIAHYNGFTVTHVNQGDVFRKCEYFLAM